MKTSDDIAPIVFLHVSMKIILNRSAKFLLPVNESIKEIVRKILNFSKLSIITN